MALGSVRRWFSLVGVSAVVAVAASGGASSGAAVVLPVVSVSPSTGLVDLQKVTVTGSGFSADAQVATVQCRPGALGQADCDLGTLVYHQADAGGAFTLSRYVRRLIVVGATTVDCGAPAGCILGAGNIANLQQANGRTIFFNPNIPPKVPAITVTPNTQLVDHQLVTVLGKGYTPETSVYVAQCVAHPPAGTFQVCDYATQRYETVNADGTFTVTNMVLERRQVVFTTTGTQTLDCAVAPGRCDIEVRASGFGSSIRKASLSFDPNVAGATVDLQRSPSSGLRDLQAVVVSGTGFTPGVAVNVVQCAQPPTEFSACDYTTSRAITAGFHGEFRFTFAVRRNLAVFVSPNGATNFDCAAVPRTCGLTIQGSPSQPSNRLALTFNRDIPATAPAIFADPRTDLRDNQGVDVLLRGFTPNKPVEIVECSVEAITEHGDLSYCDYTTVQTVTPTGPPLRTRFVVRAVLGGQGGLVDCTTRPGECVLLATESEGGYYGAGIAASPGTGSTTPTVANQSDGALPFKAAPGSTLPNIAFTKLTFLP